MNEETFEVPVDANVDRIDVSEQLPRRVRAWANIIPRDIIPPAQVVINGDDEDYEDPESPEILSHRTDDRVDLRLSPPVARRTPSPATHAQVIANSPPVPPAMPVIAASPSTAPPPEPANPEPVATPGRKRKSTQVVEASPSQSHPPPPQRQAALASSARSERQLRSLSQQPQDDGKRKKKGASPKKTGASDEPASAAERNQSDNEYFNVEKLVGHRFTQHANGKLTTEFRVRWSSYGPDEDTWEPENNLVGEALRGYKQEYWNNLGGQKLALEEDRKNELVIIKHRKSKKRKRGVNVRKSVAGAATSSAAGPSRSTSLAPAGPADVSSTSSGAPDDSVAADISTITAPAVDGDAIETDVPEPEHEGAPITASALPDAPMEIDVTPASALAPAGASTEFEGADYASLSPKSKALRKNAPNVDQVLPAFFKTEIAQKNKQTARELNLLKSSRVYSQSEMELASLACNTSERVTRSAMRTSLTSSDPSKKGQSVTPTSEPTTRSRRGQHLHHPAPPSETLANTTPRGLRASTVEPRSLQTASFQPKTPTDVAATAASATPKENPSASGATKSTGGGRKKNIVPVNIRPKRKSAIAAQAEFARVAADEQKGVTDSDDDKSTTDEAESRSPSQTKAPDANADASKQSVSKPSSTTSPPKPGQISSPQSDTRPQPPGGQPPLPGAIRLKRGYSHTLPASDTPPKVPRADGPQATSTPLSPGHRVVIKPYNRASLTHPTTARQPAYQSTTATSLGGGHYQQRPTLSPPLPPPPQHRRRTKVDEVPLPTKVVRMTDLAFLDDYEIRPETDSSRPILTETSTIRAPVIHDMGTLISSIRAGDVSRIFYTLNSVGVDFTIMHEDLPVAHHIVNLPCTIEHKYCAILRMCIEHGMSINCADNAGRTPLHVAVESKAYCMARILSSSGTSVNSVAGDEQPIGVAIRRRDHIMVKLLLRAGLDFIRARARYRPLISKDVEEIFDEHEREFNRGMEAARNRVITYFKTRSVVHSSIFVAPIIESPNVVYNFELPPRPEPNCIYLLEFAVVEFKNTGAMAHVRACNVSPVVNAYVNNQHVDASLSRVSNFLFFPRNLQSGNNQIRLCLKSQAFTRTQYCIASRICQVSIEGRIDCPRDPTVGNLMPAYTGTHPRNNRMRVNGDKSMNGGGMRVIQRTKPLAGKPQSLNLAPGGLTNGNGAASQATASGSSSNLNSSPSAPAAPLPGFRTIDQTRFATTDPAWGSTRSPLSSARQSLQSSVRLSNSNSQTPSPTVANASSTPVARSDEDSNSKGASDGARSVAATNSGSGPQSARASTDKQPSAAAVAPAEESGCSQSTSNPGEAEVPTESVAESTVEEHSVSVPVATVVEIEAHSETVSPA